MERKRLIVKLHSCASDRSGDYRFLMTTAEEHISAEFLYFIRNFFFNKIPKGTYIQRYTAG
jgi:hypothetical protein